MTFSLFLDVLLETVVDTLKIAPILYLTYLILEYIEHKASHKTDAVLEKAGHMGPLFGSLLGLIPQCGFSGAAAGFYATRTITLGTLVAVFLATSDEMLPILIASNVGAGTIFTILGIKLASGLAVGFLIDLLHHPDHHKHCDEHGDDCLHEEIHELCHSEHCKCEGKNIFLAALIHTAETIGLIFAVSLLLGLGFEWVGEDRLSTLFTARHFLGEAIAAWMGLIPNCAASVLITDLYTNGVIGIGPLLSGLLVNAGVGLLVLFRSNRNLKENVRIVCILLLAGFVIGSGIGFIL